MDSIDRRKFLATTGIVSLGALAGCTGNGDDGDVDPDSPTVLVGGGDGFKFEPEELTIEAGTTVEFVWETPTHNIVVLEQPEDADWEGEPEIFDTGHEYEYTFEVPGTYEYVCEPHEAQDMFGTIIVE